MTTCAQVGMECDTKVAVVAAGQSLWSQSRSFSTAPTGMSQRVRRARRSNIRDDPEDDVEQIDLADQLDDEDFNAEDELDEEDFDDPGASNRKRASNPAGSSNAGQRRSTSAAKSKSQSKRGRSDANGPSSNPRSAREDARADDAVATSENEINRVYSKITEYNNAYETARDGLPEGVITQQGLNTLVRAVVRHALFCNAERPGVSITRSELTGLVSSLSTSKNSKVPGVVIAGAQARLAAIFGLEMVELAKPSMRGKDRDMAVPGTGSKYFVMRSLVPSVLYASVVEKSDKAGERALTTVVLSLIDLAGGSIGEEDLWKHMNDLGVKKLAGHPALGGAAAGTLIDDLLKKRFLSLDKVEGPDGPENIYCIAENALNELGLDRIKSFHATELADEPY